MNQYPVLKYAGMDTTVQFQIQPVIVTLALTPSTISENGGMSTVTATLARSRSTATTITVRPGGRCLHGGGGFDDHHRGRGHDERVGYGGHHSGGQHLRRS